jgi:hypothetical protein
VCTEEFSRETHLFGRIFAVYFIQTTMWPITYNFTWSPLSDFSNFYPVFYSRHPTTLSARTLLSSFAGQKKGTTVETGLAAWAERTTPFRWPKIRVVIPHSKSAQSVALGRQMRRRDFIKGIAGSATAWPLMARAQSVPPMIGYLAQYKPEQIAGPLVAALHNGLGEAGLVEGKDYTSEFRSAGGDANLLPGLAAELVQHRVAVIMVDTLAAVRAATAVTTTVPIVFAMGADPVKAGLVESLNPPEASKSRRWIVPSEFNCQNSPRRRLRRFAG